MKIEIKNVTKIIKKTKVIDSVSLKFELKSQLSLLRY